MADNTEEVTLDNVFNTGENNDRNDSIIDDSKNPNNLDDDANDDAKDKKDSTPPAPPSNDTGEDEKDNVTKVKSLLSTFTSEEGLEEDNKSIRTQLLKKYKGTSFDEEGNILDENNEIVTSFEDIYKDLESPEITLDDKGNQVNEKGEIVKTKAELAADTSIVNKLHNSSEYEFLDENGETKVYSDDEEGLNEFTNDLVEQKFEDYRTRFFNQHPVLSEVAKHLLLGNDLSTFRQTVDYSSIDKKSLSEEQKLNYIRQSFAIHNMDKGRIDSMVQLIKDSNTIDKNFDVAINELKKHEQALTTQRQKEFDDAVAANEEKIERHWNTVKDVITNNKAKFVKVPKQEQDAFYNYMAMAVDNNGNSQDMLDANNLSIEEKVGLAYLRFKKFNFSKVIDEKTQQNKVNSLKDLIKRSANIKDTPVNDTVTSGKSNVDVSLSSLLDM